MPAIDPNASASGERARALDARMRELLGDGVETISDCARACGLNSPSELSRALARLRRGRPAPSLFAIYHDLVLAAAADDLPKVGGLLQWFCEVALREPDRGRLVTLSDEDLGEGGAALYRRTVDDDAGFGVSLEPVDLATQTATRVRFEEAMRLVRRADPELAEEIDVFGREIVLAAGTAGDMEFSGAATFFLWGALIVNPETNDNALSLAETLAHESGHALLFALGDAEPLTLNENGEKRRSPLRLDPRPVEGIVHATYVLARMERLMRAIGDQGELSASDRNAARAMAEHSRTLFLDGLETVRQSARFTEKGRAIFEPCTAWTGASGSPL